MTTTPDTDEEFGRRVQELRTWSGTSQRAFCIKLQSNGLPIDASALSRIEQGKRPAKLSEALVIAKVLEVDLGALVDSADDELGRFRAFRNDADRAMQDARKEVAAMVSAFLDAFEWAEAHPGVLSQLSSEASLSAPKSPADYLPWAGARMRANGPFVRVLGSEVNLVEGLLADFVAHAVEGLDEERPSGTDVPEFTEGA
jgi:transcriptional regulator with XRE-family HTH domain